MKDKLKKLFIPKRISEYFLYIALILGIILLDQFTKFLAVVYLEPIDTLPIIEGVIHLTYLENRGAAFGMLSDAPWVFNTFSVIAIIAILLYLFLGHADSKLYSIPLAMIAGGGIGNMIDRTALGYVVDFIDFRLINFAVFNGADSFVCVGAGLLIIALLLDIVNEARGLPQKSTPVSVEDAVTEREGAPADATIEPKRAEADGTLIDSADTDDATVDVQADDTVITDKPGESEGEEQ